MVALDTHFLYLQVLACVVNIIFCGPIPKGIHLNKYFNFIS